MWSICFWGFVSICLYHSMGSIRVISWIYFYDTLTKMLNLHHIPFKLILRHATRYLIPTPFQRMVYLTLLPASVTGWSQLIDHLRSDFSKQRAAVLSINRSEMILFLTGKVITGFYNLITHKLKLSL